MSDMLTCEASGVDLEGLSVYRIICGDIHSNYGWGEPYQFVRQPNPPEKPKSSALWRGFVSKYELRSDGKLYLVSYSYPLSDLEDEFFEEQLKGDFWMVMKSHFEAERLYIPFVDSLVTADKGKWEHEPPRETIDQIKENKSW